MLKLSILICTIEKRKPRFNVLMAEFKKQGTKEVEVLSNCDAGQMSIGAKRNLLLEQAKGDYLCFVDDDDWIDSEYISIILNALESEPDCVKMIGMMNTDGFSKKRFEHSLMHHKYFEQNGIFYRPPNHLNPIRSEIAKRFKFPEKNHGEDTDWALKVRDSGLLAREESIDKVIYHYRYCSRK